MIDFSRPKRAGEGPKRGHFVSHMNGGQPEPAPLASAAATPNLGSMNPDLSGVSPLPGRVFFERRELMRILSVYGRLVAAAEARDYALADGAEAAEFAVFRRSGDAPVWRIEKRPALQLRQGQWAVFGEGGQILKRGRELDQVLRVFDSRRFSVVR